ncbi:heme-binding protein [Paenibacillus sp. Soil787]|nr:heme-binding protein [Paenibacillus sp. Soil787]
MKSVFKLELEEAKMNGARNTSPEIAIAKAFTASGHRRSTHLFVDKQV